jgi:transposase
VVACLRLVSDGKVTTEVRTFQTITADLLRLSEWLTANDCTHVAMEATGVYWKPVWHILDDGEFELVLANAAHVKNVPGRKTDVNDAMWLAELLEATVEDADAFKRWRAQSPDHAAAWSEAVRLWHALGPALREWLEEHRPLEQPDRIVHS